MTRRTDRIGHLIQRELGEVIRSQLADSRVGFVTISRVDVTTDLAHAKVFVSVLGSEKDKRDSMAGLKNSSSLLRTHLSKILQTRTVPRLQFVEDKNLDHGMRVNQILNDIKAGERDAAQAIETDSGEPETEPREEDD